MKRSRRRMSRATVAALVLAIGISSICVIYKTMHGKTPAQGSEMPTLSALDVGGGSTSAQTRPSAIAVVLEKTPAPIETTTPDSLVAGSAAIGESAAPATRPAPQAAAVATTPPSWSQLLNGGTAGSSVEQSKPGAIVTGNGPLADGQARLAAGQLIDARTVLNEALQAGKLSEPDATAARASISQINQTVIFSPRTFAADPYSFSYAVRQGDSLAKIATAHDTTWELLARVNRLDPRRLRYGSNIKVIRGPIFAVVRKAAFTMDTYLGAMPGQSGSMYLMSFAVGLGKDDGTPTGMWAIGAHAKLKHPTYYPPEGGEPIGADDPKNPLGGYWIALTGVDGAAVGRSSYGIHGTIDPASIGHQASMGCIRLNNNDIALVFDLMVEGKSRVLVQ